jgi:hypothetical protein
LGIASTENYSSEYSIGFNSLITSTSNLVTFGENYVEVTIPKTFGSLDYFVESIVLENNVKLRSGEFVLLNDPNIVILRDLSLIEVLNSDVLNEPIYDSYNLGTVGFNLQMYQRNAFISTGAFSVNGSIESISLAFPELTIKDFENVKETSYTNFGAFFNFGLPSINEIGTILSTNITDVSTSILLNNAEKISRF